jgi:hypothetical protein
MLAQPSDILSRRVPRQEPSAQQESPPVVPSGAAASPPPPAPAAGPAPSSSTPILAMPGPMSAPPRSSEPAKARASDHLSEERLLAAAIRALRAESAPRSALAALDEYKAHYPQGRLLVEAEVLRVDALVALKKTTEVLHVLDGLDFSHMPGGLARQLQRAELRAAAGRQREAEADFASVLLRAHDVDVLERALWGRAQSRASLGDAQGARLDANEYVRRFPNGRFATPAARLGSPVTP